MTWWPAPSAWWPSRTPRPRRGSFPAATPAFAETGSDWLGWSGPGLYGGGCRYAPAGGNTDSASWTFDSLDPNKFYRVVVNYNGDSSHADNAPYTVLDGNTTLATVLVNQRNAPNDVTALGFTWQSLGTFQAASGRLVVNLTNQGADGIVVAGAVQLIEVPAPTTPAAPTLTVDDGDANYAESGSGWVSWQGTGLFNGDCRYHLPGSGSDIATWSFPGLNPDEQYMVEADWNASGNHADNAVYAVQDGTTTLASVQVNQQLAPAGPTIAGLAWQDLGTYQAATGTLLVSLNDLADGDVVADAVQLVPMGGPPAIASLSANHPQVAVGDTLVLTANGVQEPGGAVTQVTFYADNGSGVFNAAADTLLGTVQSGSAGWNFTVNTPGLCRRHAAILRRGQRRPGKHECPGPGGRHRDARRDHGIGGPLAAQ